MTKPVGGRGNKAPYQTTVIRIPEPLLETIDSLTTTYRESILNSQSTSNSLPQFSSINKDNAISLAQQILRKKKSARTSLQYLLQLLYSDPDLHLPT